MINSKIKVIVLVICAFGLGFRGAIANSSDTRYVKISKNDYELLKKQSLINFSILQKIKDIETLYKQVKEMLDSFTNTMNIVKKILNIKEDDTINKPENQDFEHVSGVVLSPGFLVYKAETFDKKLKQIGFKVNGFPKNFFLGFHQENKVIKFGNLETYLYI